MLSFPCIRRFKGDCCGPYEGELGSLGDVAYFWVDHQSAAGSRPKVDVVSWPVLRRKDYELTRNAGIHHVFDEDT
jgi:hypothetical protein